MHPDELSYLKRLVLDTSVKITLLSSSGGMHRGTNTLMCISQVIAESGGVSCGHWSVMWWLCYECARQ